MRVIAGYQQRARNARGQSPGGGEESESLAALYESQQRDAEKRRVAELAEAREAKRAAYAARGCSL